LYRSKGDCKAVMLVLMAFVLFSSEVTFGDSRVAVIYQETTGGFKQVFNNMIEGIEKNENADVILYEIPIAAETTNINDWLIKNKIQSVITLGSTGYLASKNISVDIPITVGALVYTSSKHGGISLAGDPELFFKYLRDLAPDVKRISIVYSKKYSGWLIELAQKAAKELDIELVPYMAENIKQGLQHYDHILKKIKSTEDAVWMPLDPVVPDKAIMPRLLKSAWDKNFVVFSNKPLHARKGVLFALYPDHKKMGFSLGKMAIGRISVTSPPVLLPAKNLKIAVNKRTASHLGLHIFKGKAKSFNIIFPSR